MASFLLSTLPRSAGAFLPFARAAVRQGISFNRAIQAYRQGAGAIGRSTALQVLRGVALEQRAASALTRLNPNRPLGLADLPEALTRIRRQFSYTAQVKGWLLDTGAETVRNVTITTDTPLSRRQVEDAARDVAESEFDRYGMVVRETVFTGGVRSGTFGTF